jgi:hypothetical protein
MKYLCTMNREELILAFSRLGKLMESLSHTDEWPGYTLGVTEEEWGTLKTVMNRQFFYNGWFTKESVAQSLAALGKQLTEAHLASWLHDYTFVQSPKRVAIIMAGNIPLVGFHDFLCVLLSGNTAVCKLSSDDKTLLPALAVPLIAFLPELKNRIEFTVGPVKNIDAVIATGSDNSSLYFEQYFGKYPHIFRKNRTSVAVLTGEETQEELKGLGHDIFDHYGLGCRNVSQLLIPKEYSLSIFFEGIFSFSEVVLNKKYGNNYDYHKAIFLMNQDQLFDNNFVLLRETSELFSPLAMVHFLRYENQEEVDHFLTSHTESIQVVVGKSFTPFGSAQCPMLSDYADGVDTMEFLNQL